MKYDLKIGSYATFNWLSFFQDYSQYTCCIDFMFCSDSKILITIAKICSLFNVITIYIVVLYHSNIHTCNKSDIDDDFNQCSKINHGQVFTRITRHTDVVSFTPLMTKCFYSKLIDYQIQLFINVESHTVANKCYLHQIPIVVSSPSFYTISNFPVQSQCSGY